MITRSPYGTAHCATFADGRGAGTRKFALPRALRWKDTTPSDQPAPATPCLA
jgi:hypothetical protein